MNLFASLQDLLSSAPAIGETIADPSLVVASGILGASLAGVIWAMRTTSGLPPGAPDIAARMAAKAAFGRTAITSLHDVQIRTQIEVLSVDHLIKVGGGAVVAGSLWLDGDVSGGARDPIWHVRRGRETLTILNPMLQVAQRVQTVRLMSHGALPVVGLVLYAGQPRFANGAPEGVVPIAQAGRKLSEVACGMPVDAARGRAWALLCDQLLLTREQLVPRRAPAPPSRVANVVRLDPTRRSTSHPQAPGGKGGAVFAFPGGAASRG